MQIDYQWNKIQHKGGQKESIGLQYTKMVKAINGKTN